MRLINSLKMILLVNVFLLLASCEQQKLEIVVSPEINTVVKFVAPQPKYPNSKLPVVVFKHVTPSKDAMQVANFIQTKFYDNGWRNSWRNGLYTFHHYHSNTHEALGIYRGWVEVQLGGPGGDLVKLEQGDVAIIPAGVAHKNVNQSDDFSILGAYPNSLSPNMRYGKGREVSSATKEINNVQLPPADPFYGVDGKLLVLWK